jgi:hypothetical protein
MVKGKALHVLYLSITPLICIGSVGTSPSVHVEEKQITPLGREILWVPFIIASITQIPFRSVLALLYKYDLRRFPLWFVS